MAAPTLCLLSPSESQRVSRCGSRAAPDPDRVTVRRYQMEAGLTVEIPFMNRVQFRAAAQNEAMIEISREKRKEMKQQQLSVRCSRSAERREGGEKLMERKEQVRMECLQQIKKQKRRKAPEGGKQQKEKRRLVLFGISVGSFYPLFH